VIAGNRSDVSAPDGRYALENVASFVTWIACKDENVSDEMGNYYDCLLTLAQPLYQFNEGDLFLIPVFGLVNTKSPDIYQGRFLAFFKDITATNGEMQRPTVFKGWNHWPLKVYSPHRVYQDVNLQAEANDALDDWESSTGLDLFTIVAQPENADVVIVYDSLLQERHHIETPELNEDGTPARREVRIYLRNTEVPVVGYAHLVFAHELGHILGLDHSRNIGHLMVGLTMPEVEHPTLDETRVVQIIYHMPSIYDFKSILED
jgi:hypothetical protein